MRACGRVSHWGDSDVMAAQRGQVYANVANFNSGVGPPVLRGAATVDGAHTKQMPCRGWGGGGGASSLPGWHILFLLERERDWRSA